MLSFRDQGGRVLVWMEVRHSRVLEFVEVICSLVEDIIDMQSLKKAGVKYQTTDISHQISDVSVFFTQ